MLSVPCSVKGCDNRAHAKGMCSLHYQRFKAHGTVSEVGTPKGAPKRYLIDIAFKHNGKSECLIWPYGKDANGYAMIWHNGGMRRVHRIVCKRVNGKPPNAKDEARHTCGNGHGGCINRHHLIWGSREQNQADRIEHETDTRGQRNGQAKLTESKVRKILKLISRNWSDAEIANRFGVSRTAIYGIRVGNRWKHIERPHV